MSIINNQLLRFRDTYQLIILCLTLVGGVLVFSFWKFDPAFYDASGHVALAEQISRSFWPFPSGWNPNQLMGWPQGVFYPSLFHWLAAVLSFSVGVEVAVKILISLAILVLPTSIFLFTDSLIKNRFWSASAVLALFLLLLILPNFLGTGFRSLFQIGLLSNFFALPFVFLFLASLHKSWDYKIASLVLAFLVLTHVVAAMVAGAYFLLFLAGKRFLEHDQNIVTPGKIIGLTLALTLFFWAPFVLNVEFTSVSRHVPSYFWINLVVLVVSMLLLREALINKKVDVFVLSLFTSIFSFLAATDAFLISNFGTSFALYPFHIYRFQPFVYLLLVIVVILSVSRWKGFDFVLKDKLVSNLLLLGGFVVVVLAVLVKSPANTPSVIFEMGRSDLVKGRFIETFSRVQVDPYWYSLQEELAKQANANWAYGLFTDSSPNGPYLGSLIKSLNPEEFSGDGDLFVETRLADEERVESILNYLGINYTISLEDPSDNRASEPKDSVGTLGKDEEKNHFSAQRVSGSPVFEIVAVPIDPVEKDWDGVVQEWWFAQGPIEEIPVKGKSDNFPSVSDDTIESAEVKLLEAEGEGSRFKLNIEAKESVPVLAKISYFPYWKATSNGEKIQIYRAAPNLMLFFANGEVDLEYKEPLVNKILYLISAISWFGVAALFASKSRLLLGKKQ